MAEYEPLKALVGSELSSVEFVRDYVQLHFDGPTLSGFARPSIAVGEDCFEWDAPGYRDALCKRIGRTVEAASVITDERIAIKFDDGACVSISLSPDDYRGPEAALLTGAAEEGWTVW